MPRIIKYWHAGDSRLIGLLALTLLLIALFLAQQSPQNTSASPNWRKIELTAVKQRLDSGDLSYQEASWYHLASPEELAERARP
ncbi:MAG: hypothetical protein ABFR65_12620 [Pseudomonadota bacterium]